MKRQYPLPLPHREAMSADDFMVAASNQEAVGWIDRWPEWPASCLMLYGPPGSGKTHLMRVWLARSQGRALDMTNLLAVPATERVLERTHWAVDDVDQLVGRSVAEEALFHLYNAIKQAQGTLLLTASSMAKEWHFALPDLRSRLLSVPSVDIKEANEDLMAALLIKQFQDRQVDVGQEVIDFVAARIERTMDSVRRVVTDLDHASLAEGRRITIHLARRVLSEGVAGENEI